MESKVIEELLEKYLEAAANLEEERRLKAYFSSGEIAPHLRQYTPLFAYFERAREDKFPRKINYSYGKRKVYSWVAVAATILILFGLGMQQDQGVHEFGTYEDPELAMEKTKEALEMVSKYMNTGTEDLGYLQEFNNTRNKIVKNP